MKSLLFIASVILCNCLISQNSLQYYIAEAKKNSPLIVDNQNQSRANQLEAERLKAFYTKPQIGITANYLFAPIVNLDGSSPQFQPNTQGATDYRGYDLAISNSGQYQALLNVTQPLFNAKKLKTVSEQVNVASQVNQNTANLSGHDLEKVVTDQYILCLQDYKQVDYTSAMINLLNEQKMIVQKLVGSSIYKQSDMTLLNIEYQNYQLQFAGFKANYKRDLLDLNILCGIKDTTFVLLTDSKLGITNSVTNSSYLEKYRLDSLSLITAKNTFELKYRPQLNVFANTGLNAVYAPAIPNRFGASAGLTFTWNFFDGKQKTINRNKTDVLLKSVSFYRENFVGQNSVRKIKILNEIQSFNERIGLSNEQLKDYQTLLNLYKKEIVTGQLSIINYINTLKNMATIQRDNTLLLSQRELLINTYNYWNW